MKIKKFNESLSSNIFEKFGNMRKEIDTLESQIFKLEERKSILESEIEKSGLLEALNDYLISHPELDDEVDLGDGNIRVELFRLYDKNDPYYASESVPDNTYLEVVYTPDSNYFDEAELRSVYLSKENVDEILMGIDAKKYNL